MESRLSIIKTCFLETDTTLTTEQFDDMIESEGGKIMLKAIEFAMETYSQKLQKNNKDWKRPEKNFEDDGSYAD